MDDAAGQDAAHQEHDGEFLLTVYSSEDSQPLWTDPSGWDDDFTAGSLLFYFYVPVHLQLPTQGPEAWRQGLGTERHNEDQASVHRQMPV